MKPNTYAKVGIMVFSLIFFAALIQGTVAQPMILSGMIEDRQLVTDDGTVYRIFDNDQGSKLILLHPDKKVRVDLSGIVREKKPKHPMHFMKTRFPDA